MVRNRRQWIRHCGYAVGKCDGYEHRLTGRSAIHLLPDRSSLDRRVVLGRDYHREMLRVLPVMNFLSVALFPTREQIGIATAANGPWLRAEHPSEHDAAVSDMPLRHAHDPVDAAKLVVAASA